MYHSSYYWVVFCLHSCEVHCCVQRTPQCWRSLCVCTAQEELVWLLLCNLPIAPIPSPDCFSTHPTHPMSSSKPKPIQFNPNKNQSKPNQKKQPNQVASAQPSLIGMAMWMRQMQNDADNAQICANICKYARIFTNICGYASAKYGAWPSLINI